MDTVSTIGGASDTGTITLIADSVHLVATPTIQTAGNIIAKEYTPGTTIGVGTSATPAA